MMTERRQVRRFLQILLRTGRGSLNPDGTMVVGGGEGREARLPPPVARKLVSQGLIIQRGSHVAPATVARAWLKRDMAGVDGFAAQHRSLVSSPEGQEVNLDCDVLLRLGRAEKNGKPFLEPHHLTAGARIASWAEKAQLRARVTMSYAADRTAGRSGAGGKSQPDLGDMAIDARRQLGELHQILPRECAEVVLDVCVYEKGLQDIEAERGWPRRSAKLVLRIGLDLLAGHFALSPVAIGEQSRHPHKWQAAGMRPMVFE